jgi:hypothetical protein
MSSHDDRIIAKEVEQKLSGNPILLIHWPQRFYSVTLRLLSVNRSNQRLESLAHVGDVVLPFIQSSYWSTNFWYSRQIDDGNLQYKIPLWVRSFFCSIWRILRVSLERGLIYIYQSISPPSPGPIIVWQADESQQNNGHWSRSFPRPCISRHSVRIYDACSVDLVIGLLMNIVLLNEIFYMH